MRLKDMGLPTRTVNALAKKKVYTAHDMCVRFPRRYRDYSTIWPIDHYEHKDYGAIKGRLMLIEKREGKSRPYLFMKIKEPTGRIVNIMSFANLYKMRFYEPLLDEDVVVCGQILYDPVFGYSMTNPDEVTKADLFKGHIDTIYPGTKGVSDQNYRSILLDSTAYEKEYLPEEMVRAFALPPLRKALETLHFPQAMDDIALCRERFLFEDLLYFSSNLKGNEGPKETRVVFRERGKAAELLRSLPYQLTSDQMAAVRAMMKNSLNGIRNNILLQGDVGCGKTIVAALMMVNAAENGYQALLLAPREVLAAQHYQEIKGYADILGIETVYLHAGIKGKDKKEIIRKISSGEASLIVGTHAALAEGVTYNALGLIVTDEEHLFGAAQKEKIIAKASDGVHTLSMSATPIPRSIALSLYGDSKEILTIKTRPEGRLPIKTAIQKTHRNIFPFMEKEIRAGHKCYVVCPAIDDNDEIDIVSLESMEKEYRSYFEPKRIPIGVINGKMSKDAVEETVRAFSEGRCPILMSTTVIEVGVNVPDATVMVIEQADRFGLASLHQLRGRVGRSSLQSYCILRSEDETNERLITLTETNDGFEIAEKDMMMRGAGNLIGEEQSGMDRYFELMVSYPDIFKRACEARDRFNGQYKEMMELYEEHLSFEGDR